MKRCIPAYLSNFMLLMVLYTACRLIFYAVNATHFPDLDADRMLRLLAGGLRFDLSALLYLNLPYLLLVLLPFHFRIKPGYSALTKWVYLVPNWIGLVSNFCDMVYFPFTTRRTTWRIFDEFADDSNLPNIIAQACVDNWYLVLTVLLMGFLTYRLYQPYRETNRLHGAAYYLTHSAAFGLCLYLTVVGIRGGFGVTTRPINLSNAAQYCNRPEETALVLNTPFSLIRTIESPRYVNPGYFDSRKELEAWCNPVRQPHFADKPFRACNVVVIILESFASEYSAHFNPALEGPGYTPFLDSLAREGLSMRCSFATGKQSIEALPSVFAGIPGLFEPYVVTQYANNDITTLPRLLRQKGYETAFFHGADANSIGLQAFARSAGFEKLYDRGTYGNERDFDGTWGIWDEEFLQYFAAETGKLKEPFLASVFTLSSHHPFKLPERYEGRFAEGPHPMYACVGYTDHALRRYFETARKQPWYRNTLFVLTGDHTTIITRPEFLNGRGLYQVPIVYYHPADSTLRRRSGQITAQTDITPSILDYLHYDQPCFSFGQSVFGPDSAHCVVNYYRPYVQLIEDSLLLQFHEGSTQGLYNYVTDLNLENNLIDHPRRGELETRLKAYIQQYMTRMVENRLSPDK